MQKSELIKLFRNAGSLNEETLSELLQLKEQYPYFQAVRLLALKNKFVLGHSDNQHELESVSAYVSDRSVIYDLLYPSEVEEITEEEPDLTREENDLSLDDANNASPQESDIDLKKESEKGNPSPTLRENISNLLSWQLEELELMDPNEAELVPETALDINKSYGNNSGIPDETDLLTIESEPEDTESGPKITGDNPVTYPDKKELIEKFMECNPKIEPLKDNRPVVDISEDSVREHDGIFTDTLAKIYVKQGYYSKAIFVYEKLILKFPEKRLYFADQIDTIKKLLNK